MQEEFTFLENKRLKILIDSFHAVLGEPHHTILVSGAKEPVYRPSCAENSINTINFTRDYFSSALHEIAHWCIAGEARRKVVDYGYWYCPDGRDDKEQSQFESVEIKPQALERIFCKATGQRFHLSADNLNRCCDIGQSFAESVHRQTLRYCNDGTPHRALVFVGALEDAFGHSGALDPHSYTLRELTQS